MDYQSIYDRIIERNRNTPKIKKCTEIHHIIPRSFAKLDGIEDIDGEWNKVNLSVREHFICHLLLARIWKGHKTKGPKMSWAFIIMTGHGKYTSKEFSWMKLNYSHTTDSKQKMSQSHQGKKLSNETKAKMSKTRKGRLHTDEAKAKMRKPKSEETKQKISKSRKGKLLSEETKQKITESLTGRTLSESHKAKLSRINVGKKLSDETKAKMRKPKSEETKQKISEARKKKGL